jgi:hypothetical protein
MTPRGWSRLLRANTIPLRSAASDPRMDNGKTKNIEIDSGIATKNK